MPYNTRRKSLSLPSLGIQLPQSSRQHQSPPASAKGEQPPQKKVKRDHSPLINVANQSTTRYEPTPPLSPPPERNINHEEIGDEIVSGVVNILETTGNRPHTVKELATVLAPTINIVEKYAHSALVAWYNLGYAVLTRQSQQLGKSTCDYIITTQWLP